MKIFIDKNNETKELTFQGTVKNLLLKLEINPETVIVVSNDIIVTEDEILSNKDEIKILSAVSGG